MTYDLISGFDTVTGHHTPLYSTPKQLYSADNAVSYLTSIGVPPGKLVVGAAFATFDNKESLQQKTKYALEKRLNGIMFWQLTHDTYRGGLLEAIHSVVK